MPKCSEGKIAFGWVGRRVIEGGFNGGDLSSDGGLMLLKRTDERIGLTRAVAAVLSERRDPDLPQHLLHAPAPKAPVHGLVVRMGLARSIVEATVIRGAAARRTAPRAQAHDRPARDLRKPRPTGVSACRDSGRHAQRDRTPRRQTVSAWQVAAAAAMHRPETPAPARARCDPAARGPSGHAARRRRGRRQGCRPYERRH